MKGLALLPVLLLAACAASQPLPKNVTATPDPLAFGKVFVGDSKDDSVTLANARQAAVPVQGAGFLAGTIFANAPGFPVLPLNLAPAGRQAFPLRFTPPAVGAFSGAWSVTVNGRTHTVALSGTGVYLFQSPLIVLTHGDEASGLDFGQVLVNSSLDLKHQLTENGTNLTITLPTVTGAGFRLKHPKAGDNLNLGLVPPNVRRIKVEIEFKPTQVGLHTGLLTITDSTGRLLAKTFLQGVGVLPPAEDAPNDQ